MLFNDNEEGRMMFETCMQKGKRVVNPIVDWEDSDVWDYLNGRCIPHCSLYDEGFPRIGCIGCPMATARRTEREFKRWPKFKQMYIRAYERMIAERKRRGLNLKTNVNWSTGKDVLKWQIYGRDKHGEGSVDGQTKMDEE
jgi:phosphoadenosine phosphosulfate reductase